MAEKETFTQEELGLIATSLNTKIRELEEAIPYLQSELLKHAANPDEVRLIRTMLSDNQKQLSEVRQVQQKAFRMYKFK